MKKFAFLLMSLVLVFAVAIGQSAKDSLGAAAIVGAVAGVFTATPIIFWVAIAARGGLHIHLHRHEQPRQLREPIDADARMIEGPTQVTITKN